MTIQRNITVHKITKLEPNRFRVTRVESSRVIKSNGTVMQNITYNNAWFEYEQIVAAAVWNITHTLNKKPSVNVVDSGDNVVIGSINYVDLNHLTITFSAAFSGKAYLT